MRNINAKMTRDDFFMDLDYMQRLLWIGLIVSLADDQGRLSYNPRSIKVELFPCDNEELEDIEAALNLFAEKKKILIYTASDKRFIQILNWWKYQSSSAWMGKSSYPPPEGWVDCWRFHSTNNSIDKSPNWDTKEAGFIGSAYVAPTLPLPSRDVNSNVNSNSEVNSKHEEIAEKNNAAANSKKVDQKIIKALDKAGIHGPKAEELASLPHMSPEYIQAHAAYAATHGEGIGLVITRMQNKEPIPKKKEQEKKGLRGEAVASRVMAFLNKS